MATRKIFFQNQSRYLIKRDFVHRKVACLNVNLQYKDQKLDDNKFFFIASVDVTNREKVLEAGSQVQKDVGPVTILINNAGIMPSHDLLQHTEAEIKSIFKINVVAHFWMFQAFVPKMIENNRGHIVALSSMAGIMGFQNLVPYCGSKFAVRGIQEAFSEELRCKTQGKSQVTLLMLTISEFYKNSNFR